MKYTHFSFLTGRLATCISVVLLCVFSVTILINSFSILSEEKVVYELSETPYDEGDLPISDKDSQKEESEKEVEEFMLNKKYSPIISSKNKNFLFVTHKLQFNSRIIESFTPPPRLI
jgi:hypothetical protein